MADRNQRNFYAWTDGATGMVAWVLVMLAEVTTAVSLLRNFPHSRALPPIIFVTLGVSFIGGLLLALVRNEISIDDTGLKLRRGRLFSRLLRMPWVERRIARASICGFRLDKSPWRERKLTIIMDDGSSVGVQGGSEVSANSGFDVFVSAFRSFAGRDLGHKIAEGTDAWLLPVRRTLVGGAVVACGVLSLVLVRAVFSTGAIKERSQFLILAVFAVMMAVEGIRFLRKRSPS